MSTAESIKWDMRGEGWPVDMEQLEKDILTALLAGDRNEQLFNEILNERPDWLIEQITTRVAAGDIPAQVFLLYLVEMTAPSWLAGLAERIAEKEAVWGSMRAYSART